MDFRSNYGESNDFITYNQLVATSIMYCHSETSSLKKTIAPSEFPRCYADLLRRSTGE